MSTDDETLRRLNAALIAVAERIGARIARKHLQDLDALLLAHQTLSKNAMPSAPPDFYASAMQERVIAMWCAYIGQLVGHMSASLGPEATRAALRQIFIDHPKERSNRAN